MELILVPKITPRFKSGAKMIEYIFKADAHERISSSESIQGWYYVVHLVAVVVIVPVDFIVVYVVAVALVVVDVDVSVVAAYVVIVVVAAIVDVVIVFC